MIELRGAVGADLLYRRVQIGLRKAVRLRFRHFVFFGAFIVHFVHPFYDAVKNFLLSGVVLVERRFRDPQPAGNVAHGRAEIPILRKQLQCRFHDPLFCVDRHIYPPLTKSDRSVTYSIVTERSLVKSLSENFYAEAICQPSACSRTSVKRL